LLDLEKKCSKILSKILMERREKERRMSTPRPGGDFLAPGNKEIAAPLQTLRAHSST
jgi:hypothetical protein